MLSSLLERGLRVCFWLIFLFAVGTSGCDVPGLREYGSFAHALNCTRAVTQCQLVVVTTIFDKVDILTAPVRKVSPALPTCYYAFLDVPTFHSLSRDTPKDSVHKRCDILIKNWHVVVIPNEELAFKDARLDSRVIKILMHLFFPAARYHVYIDGNKKFRHTIFPSELVKNYLVGNGTLQSPQYLLALPQHTDRNNIDEEAAKILTDKLDYKRTINHQIDTYHLLLPSKTSIGPLLLGSFRVQANTPLIRAYECLWFYQTTMHSRRDQMSLPKVVNDLNLWDRMVLLSWKEILYTVPHRNEPGRRLNDYPFLLANNTYNDHLLLLKSKRKVIRPVRRRSYTLTQPGNTFSYSPSRSPSPSPSPFPPAPLIVRDTRGFFIQHFSTTTTKQVILEHDEYFNRLSRMSPDQWQIIDRPQPVLTATDEDTATAYNLKKYCKMEDFVIILIETSSELDAAKLLRRYISKGVMPLVDLLLVYSDEPEDTQSDAVVEFRTTLRDAVEEWGVAVFPHWSPIEKVGWIEKVWQRAWKKNDALDALLP